MKHFDSISVSKNPLYLLIWLRGLVVKQVSQFEDLGGGLGKQPRSDLPSPSVTNSPQNLTTTHYSVLFIWTSKRLSVLFVPLFCSRDPFLSNGKTTLFGSHVHWGPAAEGREDPSGVGEQLFN